MTAEQSKSITLQAAELRCTFGGVMALDGVDLDVPAGACVALVGESGAGKTTLLRCFNRMTHWDAGQVRVGGEDVTAVAPEQLRRRIGYVPQSGGLLPHWTVLRNAAFVPWLLGRGDAQDAAAEALALVGLSPETFGRRFPHELSGGQRQRTALARALAARPGVLLMDEPFGALDAITRGDLQGVFARLRGELGITTLLVTHDLLEAGLLADRIAVMRNGRIEQIAPLAELRRAPATDYVGQLIDRALAAPAQALAG